MSTEMKRIKGSFSISVYEIHSTCSRDVSGFTSLHKSKVPWAHGVLLLSMYIERVNKPIASSKNAETSKLG